MGTRYARADANGEIIPGTLEMLILKTLANGPMNGADIASSIHAVSGGALTATEGALYPALHRLRRGGFVECTAGVSHNKRQAKFYSLTEAGTRELEQRSAHWVSLANAVGKIMQNP